MATRNFSVSNHALDQFRARLGTHHWASLGEDVLREKLDQAILHSMQDEKNCEQIITEGRLCTLVDLEPETKFPMSALLTNNEQKAGVGSEFRLAVLTTLTRAMCDNQWSRGAWTRPGHNGVLAPQAPLRLGLKDAAAKSPIVQAAALRPTPKLPTGAVMPNEPEYAVYCAGEWFVLRGDPSTKLIEAVELGLEPILYKRVPFAAKRKVEIEL